MQAGTRSVQSARETKGGAEPAVLTLMSDERRLQYSSRQRRRAFRTLGDETREVVARRVKIAGTGCENRAMGAAATLPGDRITDRRLLPLAPLGRCGVCAVGIEPNPLHRSRLAALERAYRAAGVGVTVMMAAASTQDGVTTLTINQNNYESKHEDWGATMHGAIKKMANRHSMPVRSVGLPRLVRLLRELLDSGGDRGGRIAAKIDIEFEEYRLVPAMAVDRSACLLSGMYVEWHAENGNYRPRHNGTREYLEALRNNTVRAFSAEDCGVDVSALDDETYLHDVKAWVGTVAGDCARAGSAPPAAA